MNLPDSLVSETRAGRVVFLLGAGASFGATTPGGEGPLTANGLRDALSQQFLGGKYAEESLVWVAELAASATGLGRVQDFIAERFKELDPAAFHLLLPKFRWHGLATTNYDRVIEKAYESVTDRVQELVPFISNDDHIEEKLRSENDVALLKLHGCVTRTDDPDLPLILTADQYALHRSNRDQLFDTFLEWAADHTVVFVGHALQDPDLRMILLQVSEQLDFRPRYYLIRPNVSETEKDLWARKRITVLDGTFEDFLNALDEAIPESRRALVRVVENEHAITRRYVVNEPFAGPIADLLHNDAQYVHDSLEFEQSNPKRFYKGFDLGWYPIVEELDVRRRLTDTVLYDIIARPEGDRPTRTELYLIKAEAGAGKSVFLRRLAWDAATDADALCIFVNSSGHPRFEGILELHRVTKERIFLFIDSAADNVVLIARFIEEARRNDVPLTLITAERVNEWNMFCNEISGYLSEEYTLPYLSRSEISDLVTLLEEHDAQGPALRGRSRDEQIRAFEVGAGRQLLVALHEATMGRPFEEILLDEYHNIHPQEAQSLYLTVCFPHRLNVLVRAGLIARVHDIPFTRFRERFFGPLEHVVLVREDRATRDYAYLARHPEIAQIVFGQVLSDRADRYNEYVRILKYLNVAYSSDRESFRKLIRARTLRETFQQREDVLEIFKVAKESVGEEAYHCQQMANYERITNGDFSRAYELLQRARELDRQDTTIVHSLAELARTRANNAERALERRKFRNEAYAHLHDLPRRSQTDRYARHTFLLLAMDEVRDLLADNNSVEQDIDDAIRQVERTLETARQQFPEESVFRTAEATFASLLKDSERSVRALQAAFQRNPRDPFIAIRLARVYEKEGDLAASREVLHQALERNPSNKQIHFTYAEILRVLTPSDVENLAYHYRKAFAKWDDNHEAQFWYARYAFDDRDADKRREAKDIFRRLREIYMQNDARHTVRDRTFDGGRPKRFEGTISRIAINYGFVTTDGRGDEVFFHRNGAHSTDWKELLAGKRITFEMGFAFSGPVALKIQTA
jgi:tetratricopeptide (TPR) repeat protein/cold shock CspA family protein